MAVFGPPSPTVLNKEWEMGMLETASDVELPNNVVSHMRGMTVLTVMSNASHAFKLVRSSVGQILRRTRI